MSKIIPVDEYRGLYRNVENNSIINTDESAYLAAISARKARKNLISEISSLKDRLSVLENRISNMEKLLNK